MMKAKTTWQIRRYRDYREYMYSTKKEDVCIKRFTDEQKCIDFINSMALNDYQWEDWGAKATPENLCKVTFSAKADDPIANKYLGPYDHGYDLTFHVVKNVTWVRV